MASYAVPSRVISNPIINHHNAVTQPGERFRGWPNSGHQRKKTPGGSMLSDTPQRKGRGRPPKKKPEQAKKQRKRPNHEKMMADAIKGSEVVQHSLNVHLTSN
ncbi:hypothetical protein M514_23210 [Trichuris suis]|uniref:Uncharacterized protein n=1 Tax=Trichuris suis TaxID=68888 RepID=A0A085N562_9BILA|nr:hypothetical protein M514_23210 [Trichuris suis]